MPIQPIIRDDNGFPLADRGSEMVTRRYSGVDTGGQAISLGVDIKEAVVHIEGGSVKAKFTGTVSGSEEICWTSDGCTLPPMPLVKESGRSIITVAAQSGTINVSVLAWR